MTRKKESTGRDAQDRGENFTVRLDAKTRFQLEFVAHATDRSMTKVIEHAIKRLADETRVKPLEPPDCPEGTWRDYWHANEGVRRIHMLLVPPFDTTYEDDVLRRFVDRHKEFFCDPREKRVSGGLSDDRVEVLWPRIREFVDLWERTKTNDRDAAAQAMREALAQAGIEPPQPSKRPDDRGEAKTKAKEQKR